jgi:hypothetical protein
MSIIIPSSTFLVQDAIARPYAQSYSAVDTFPQAIVQYVPSGGTGGTAATCQVVSATSLTFQVDGANPAGADAIGDASGVVAFATYTTMGALKDYIDGLSAWRMILIGAKRADASASKLLTAAATSCLTEEGLRIYGDASATDHLSFAITGEKFVNYGANGHVKEAGRTWNTLLSASINVGLTGSSPQIEFSFEAQKATPAIQVAHTLVMADDTLEEIGVANPSVPYLQSPLGMRIIGRVSAATSVDDIATFNVLGKSTFIKGDVQIHKVPW